MTIEKKQVRSVLMGGIGNQLFQYSYGCLMAEKYAGNISLDLRGLPTRGQQKDSSILDLEIEYLAKKTAAKTLTYFWKIWILRSLKSSPSPLSDFFLGVSRDPEVSTNKQRDFSVADFFTDKTAIRHFRGALPLRLSYLPSRSLLSEYAAVSMESTVTIHHRLGDAVKLKKTRGLLGSEYFKKSLMRVSEVAPVDKIRVYSDQPDLSRVLLGEWLSDYEISWAPLGFSAAEVLTSLARARHLVLSNSTMSWWAAAGGIHKSVVAPSSWTVFGSKDLNLEGWMLCDPNWS